MNYFDLAWKRLVADLCILTEHVEQLSNKLEENIKLKEAIEMEKQISTLKNNQ